LWVPPVSSATGRPRGATTSSTAKRTATQALFDRAAELAAIEEALERALAGAGGLLTIEGPAGVGKTSLVQAAAAAADRRGIAVLSATGSELETAFPFGGARQLFERRLAAMDGAERAQVLAGAAHQAAAVVGPEVSETLSPDANAVVHGLYWLTANLAADGPLVLIVDDAHWLDLGSLRFLHYLARRIDELPIPLVLATRPLQPTSADPSLGALLTLGTALSPGPLSRASVAEIVRRETGTEPDDAFVAACERASSGNALLLIELVRALSADGAAPTEESVEAVGVAAPEAIRRRVTAVMAGLSARARLLAWAVAILGESEVPLAGELAQLDAGDVQAALLALDQTGLMAPDGARRFAHPLIANAVMAEIPPAARSGLHAGAARLLAAAGGSPDVVAAHLLATFPGADPWVVTQLREAATQALARGGPETAVAYLERALAEPPGSEQLAATLHELGTAQMRAADWAEASRTLRRALAASTSDDEHQRLVIALVRAQMLSSEYDDAVDLLGAEREPLADDDPRAVELDRELLGITLLDVRRRARVPDRSALYRAKAEHGKLEDPTLLVRIAASRILAAEPPEHGLELLRRALPAVDLWGDQGDLLSWICATLTAAGCSYEVIELLDPLLVESRTRGEIVVSARMLGFLAHACYRAGNLVDAEAHGWLTAALHEQMGGEEFFPFALLDALIERGQVLRALEVLGESRTSGFQQRDAMGMLMRGRVLAAKGDTHIAFGLLLAAGQEFDALGFVHPRFAPWRGLAAPLAAKLGQLGIATSLAEENVELARATRTPSAIGHALRVSGAIHGDADELAEACSVLREDPDTLEFAYALTELGELHLAGGRQGDARARLREALATAQAAGATAVGERARRMLQAAGGRPRRAARTGIEALTPSELQVARLAAEGLTNREIAQALFITLKTVERHLNRVYAKLQIPGRPGLAAALGQ
jgi:DNA-binding CsgD family transcriptional regulator